MPSRTPHTSRKGRELRRVVLLTALIVILLPATHAIPSEVRALAPEDLFRLQGAVDPQISPDGRHIAYVRLTPDIMTDRIRSSIWLLDVVLETDTAVAASPGSHMSPRWSPDGRKLAFQSQESGVSHLVVRSLESQDNKVIADLRTVPPGIAWSPDSRAIAYASFVPDRQKDAERGLTRPAGAAWADPLEFTSDVYHRFDEIGNIESGRLHIFVVPADGGPARQLTGDELEFRGPKRPEVVMSWTPDGRFLVVGGHRGSDWRQNPFDTELFKISATDGEFRQLTNRRGADESPAVSPDGRFIAYAGYDHRAVSYQDSQLFIMDADGSNPRLMSGRLDLPLHAFRWAADSKSIYMFAVERGISKVIQLEFDGEPRTLVTGLGGGIPSEPYSGGSYSVSRDGTVAFVDSQSDRPGDVFLANGRERKRLTRLNDQLLAARTIGRTISLPLPASATRPVIDAWIVTPPGFAHGAGYPAILLLHGGPYASYAPIFSTDVQLFAAAGYVVVYANQRGSTSYGKAFADSIHGNFPGVDADDVISIMDAVIAAGYCDPQRLFITGGSSGGLLTTWIIGKTGRFRAAVAQRPMIDWLSGALTTDRYNDLRHWFGALPWEEPLRYWERSSISLVGNVTTPTMLIAASEDKRAPPSQAEEYYNALTLRGVPSALVRIPGAGHGSFAARPSQSAHRVMAVLGWFNRHDSGRPDTGQAGEGL